LITDNGGHSFVPIAVKPQSSGTDDDDEIDKMLSNQTKWFVFASRDK